MPIIYSDDENQCLLDELRSANSVVRRECFAALHELWPGLFCGRERSQRGLFIQMVRLAKKNNIPFIVASAPKRIRKRYKKTVASALIPAPVMPSKKPPKKPKLQEQMLAILRNELGYAEKRMVKRIASLVSEAATENVRLTLEIKELRSFKKDVEMTRGDRTSPVMERHYLKAGD